MSAGRRRAAAYRGSAQKETPLGLQQHVAVKANTTSIARQNRVVQGTAREFAMFY
jgi:hypothetical protein